MASPAHVDRPTNRNALAGPPPARAAPATAAPIPMPMSCPEAIQVNVSVPAPGGATSSQMCAAFTAIGAIRPVELACPITAIGWRHDASVDPASMRGWTECGRTTFATLDGTHESFVDAPDALLRLLAAA